MDWLVFDYAGVISHPPPDEAGAELAAALDTTTASLWPAYWADRAAYDTAAIDATTYWHGVSGRPLDAELVTRLVALDTRMWLHLNTDTLTVLEDLARQDIPLALLSNAPLEIARTIDGEPWADLFRHRFFSADLGLAKPDLRIYDLVCRRLDTRPGNVVFVDDRPENVDAAREFGIDALLFTTAARLREQARQ